MKKVVYIISDIDKALAFEWTAIGLRPKFALTFILIGKGGELSAFLRSLQIPVFEINDSEYPSWWSKFIRIFFLLRREKPDIVHTHLWRANLLGLSSAWLLRIKKRVYTRHHALVHYREYPRGRKWDKLCNAFATHIIAISSNIQEILVELDKANASKVHLIRHGFDLAYFEKVEANRKNALISRYQLNVADYPLIGVIARYVSWKGIQFVIPAFKKLKSDFPDAKLILANAHGSFEDEIKRQLQNLPADSFVEIRFEGDLAALYHLLDVYIHVPVDPQVEAFGQTYVEALAAGVPSVFTKSGIAREIIKHKENAWVVEFENSDQIAEGVTQILKNPELRGHLIRSGKSSLQIFSIETHILALEKLYAD